MLGSGPQEELPGCLGRGSGLGEGKETRAEGQQEETPGTWREGRAEHVAVSGWTRFGQREEGLRLGAEARPPSQSRASEPAVRPPAELGTSTSSPVRWSVCFSRRPAWACLLALCNWPAHTCRHPGTAAPGHGPSWQPRCLSQVPSLREKPRCAQAWRRLHSRTR